MFAETLQFHGERQGVFFSDSLSALFFFVEVSLMKVEVFSSLRLMATLCVALASTACHAALTYNVDFNRNAAGLTYSGTASAPDTGTTWNGVTGSGSNGSFMLNAANNLLDSQGNAGTADLTSTTIYGSFSNDAGSAGAPLPHDLMYDYLTLRGNNNPGNGAGVTMTVSDLPAGKYKLWIYGAGDSTGQAGQFDIPVANQVLGGISTGTTSSASRNIADAGNPGVNWVVLDAQTAGGSLSFQWSLTGDKFSQGNFSGVNGFQLQQVVPEPTSLLLLFTSVTGSLIGMRRRSAV